MSSRYVRVVAGLGALALCAAIAPNARAMDPKVEEAAKKAAADAMDVDFLSLDMKKAKKKLSNALKKCGKDKCSKPMLGLLHRNLGIVAINAKDTKSGDSEFAQALANDPNVTVPKDYLDNPAVKKAWETAKKNAGGGGDGGGSSGGGGGGDDEGGTPAVSAEGNLSVKLKAAPIGYELPVVIEVPDGTKPAKVKLSFKTSAMDKYKIVDAKKVKNKWLVIIDCDATTKAGTLKMFVRAYDDDDVELEHWGTIKKPAIVKVTDAIADEDRPMLPGDEEPKTCGGGGDEGDDAEPCTSDDDCKKGATCVEDDKTGEKTCRAPDDDEKDKPSAGAKDAKKLWFGVDGQFDMLFIGQQSELCKQKSWACTVDTVDGRQDVGVPDATGVAIRNEDRTGGKTDGGSAFGTKHVWLSIDYFVASKFSIGTRLGYIIGGNPTDVAKFNPIHFEARAQYFFTESGVRPYILLNSGYARTEGSVGGVIVTPNDPTKATNGNGTIGDVTAWKLGGPIFIGTGFGMWVGIGDRVALNLALKVLVPLPVLVPAFAPEAGIKFGF